MRAGSGIAARRRQKERCYGIEIAPKENEISREWPARLFADIVFDVAVNPDDSAQF